MGALAKREFVRRCERNCQQNSVFKRQTGSREPPRICVVCVAEALTCLDSGERICGILNRTFWDELLELITDRKGKTLDLVVGRFIEHAEFARRGATMTPNRQRVLLFRVAVNQRPDSESGQAGPALNGVSTSLVTDEAHGQCVAADVTVVPVIGDAHVTSSSCEEGFNALVG